MSEGAAMTVGQAARGIALGHEEPAQPADPAHAAHPAQPAHAAHPAQAAHPARAQRAPLHEAVVFDR